MARTAVIDASKIVALYVRVSTGYQVDKDSLPHQIKELKAYCKHVLHLDNVVVFEDAGKSAKNTERPAFKSMMQKIKDGQVSHVIVYKIDRISRNLVDFSLMYDIFKQNRVTFISLNEQFDTSTAMGEAMLKIILVFAELERKMTSERVMDIMLDRANSKQWNGARMPLGYAWDKEKEFPVIDDKEVITIRLIYDMYQETHSSCAIRNYLNDNDICTKRGGEWTSKTVSDIIRNPMYKGTYRYNYRESARGKIKPQEEWIIIDDVFPPIIKKEQWQLCNAEMDIHCEMRNQNGFQPLKKYYHVFGGLLRCGVCGSNMLSNKDKERESGFKPSVYKCGNRYRKNTCRPKGVTDVTLGPFVFNYIKNVVKVTKSVRKLENMEDMQEMLLSGLEFKNIKCLDASGLSDTWVALGGTAASGANYKPVTLKDDGGNDNAEAKLRTELQKNYRALDRLKKAFLYDDDVMTENEYLETKQEITGRISQMENKLAEMVHDDASIENGNLSFVITASSFLIAYKLNQDEHIEYSEFAPLLDDKVLKDFVASVIDKIVIMDGQVDAIVFKNGLTHKFIRE